MKYSPSTRIVLCLLAIASALPIQAQPQSVATPAEALAARATLQASTNDLNAALLRGDAASVLALLAPDFELGHHQYRKRDAAWMRQALPRQLDRAQFAELTTTLSAVELSGGQAVARGKIAARAALKAGGGSPGVSGSVVAVWVKTPAGWRLKSDDETFRLLQILLPDAVLGVIPALDLAGNKAALLRDPPATVLEQGHEGAVASLAFAPDGAVLATYDFYDGLRFTTARMGAFLKALHTPMAINSMTYAPNGTLVTGHNNGMARVWDTASGTLKQTLAVSRWSIYAVRVSPDGHTLAADGGKNVQLWDIATGQKLHAIGQSGGSGLALDFSPDGSTLAFNSGAGVELRNVQTATLVQTLKGEQWGAFTPDGKTMITVTGGRLRFRAVGSEAIQREVAIPDPLRKPRPPTGNFGVIDEMVYEPGATIAPNGALAASIYADGSIGVWDTRTGTLRHLLRGFQSDVMGGDVSTITFSPDSATLAVGSRSGETALWQVK